MFISIVIPTHNRPHFLAQCLEPLSRQLAGVTDVDVHVVDDGSGKAHAATNRTLCSTYKVNYHRSEKNRGMAVARNIGLDYGSGSWIVFIDDDFRVDDHWFPTLVQVLNSQNEEVVGVEGKIEGAGEGLWDREVQSLSGGLFLTCHIAYRKSVLDAIGGFDPQFEFEGPFCEDHELAARALRRGAIVFAPELTGLHLPRRIRLASYIASSFKRVRGLLRAEYHFFCKQCDGYHRFRHSRTFWGTYLSLLMRNVVNNVRRRRAGDCVRHPLQFLALLLASLLEQIGAWLLLPHFIAALIRDRSCYFHTCIDEGRTRALWRFAHGDATGKLRYRYAHLRSLLFPLFKIPVYDVRPMLRRMKKLTEIDNCKILLRIDDIFLNIPKAVDCFIDIMEQKRFPFLAGVKGNDLVNPSYLDRIERLRGCGGEIGIHGFSHKGRFGPFASEIMQMKYPAISAKIAEIAASEAFTRSPPLAFMPPYNAIAGEQIAFLARQFPIITGGPETMRFSDRFAGPLAIKDGGWYIPTSHPYYTCARDLLNANLHTPLHLPLFPNPISQLRSLRGFICISLHMTEEAKDGYAAFGKLLDALPTPPLSWRVFTKDQDGGAYFSDRRKET